MSSLLLTAPAVEPLSLAEAKAFLRVETGDDDDVITALIAGARIHVEAQTRRALITQSWRIALDAWPADGRLPVLPAPLQALDRRARLRRRQHRARRSTRKPSCSTSARRLCASRPGRCRRRDALAAGIELDVTVGYGDAASDVPEPLRQAIRLLVAHWYENRGLVARGSHGAVLPADRGGADRALPDVVAMTAPVTDIGDLNRRLVLQAPVETDDGEGGVMRSLSDGDHAVGASVAAVGARRCRRRQPRRRAALSHRHPLPRRRHHAAPVPGWRAHLSRHRRARERRPPLPRDRRRGAGGLRPPGWRSECA